MNKRSFKTLVVSLLMLLVSSSLFAVEEYISQIYKDLDHVFIIKSDKELNDILSKNNEDKYYYLIENYTEKKIRRLIVNNDYDFAMTAIIIVIENNLDNENAVDMYTVIANAYEVQQKMEQENEERRQKELVRIEMEKDKQRGSAEKEYVSASNTSSGRVVYVSGKEPTSSSSSWKASFGMVDLTHLYDEPGDISTIHYGISGDYRYEYSLEKKIVVGADLSGGLNFLTIADEDKMVPILADANIAFKFALPQLSPNFFFRAGVGAIVSGTSSMAPDTKDIAPTMFSPTIGIKMERIPLGKLKLDLGADWYAGHLFYEDINLAIGGDLNLEVPFAELEKINLSFNLGVKDRFFLKTTGIENRASVILAIGVGNVNK